VFPHVAGQQRRLAGGERAAGIAGADHFKAAGGVLDQPAPAGAEGADGGLAELFLECVERAEGLVDGRRQGARRLAASVRREAIPIEGVVPDLRRVVEDAAARLAHDVLERQVLEFGARDELVQVVDVGLVMLAVVELQGFLGDVRGQGVDGIGQGGQLVGHGGSSLR
jgi:hypothetical protein